MYVLTYWQVYLIMGAGALAVFWAGWGARSLAARAPAAGRHAAGAAALPLPLPPAPPLATAALEAAHGNVMARAAPHEPWPLARAWANVVSVATTLAVAGATARIVSRLAADRDSPWADATGTFPALIAELGQDA